MVGEHPTQTTLPGDGLKAGMARGLHCLSRGRRRPTSTCCRARRAITRANRTFDVCDLAAGYLQAQVVKPLR
jgi:hypothetical protein